MKKLSTQFLDDIGIKNIDDTRAARMLEDIFATLEMRVGMALANTLDEETLDSINNSDDLDEAWYAQHAPNYKQIVEQETEKLKAELIEERKKLTKS